MIGPLFAINLDNVVRAAIAEVMKDLKWDAPVEITARTQEHGIAALIPVAGTSGDAHEMVVRESSIADCLSSEDDRAAAQDLVSQLATEIRRLVDATLR